MQHSSIFAVQAGGSSRLRLRLHSLLLYITCTNHAASTCKQCRQDGTNDAPRITLTDPARGMANFHELCRVVTARAGTAQTLLVTHAVTSIAPSTQNCSCNENRSKIRTRPTYKMQVKGTNVSCNAALPITGVAVTQLRHKS